MQIDEPALTLDLVPNEQEAFKFAYGRLAAAAPGLQIMLNTYFGELGANLDTALSLPVHGLHIDLVRAPEQLGAVAAKARPDLVLSLGVVDGRNIWRSNLTSILDAIEPVVATHGLDRIEIAPSCSLLHVPIDVELEGALEPDLKSWLAFAAQKMDELATIAGALAGGRASVQTQLDASAKALDSRASSLTVNDPLVQGRMAEIGEGMKRRKSPFAERRKLQAAKLRLPAFPTTTIGSFPQTAEVRKARSRHAKGELSYMDYDAFLKKETAATIRWQEEIGLDVLAHGEFERNDMVQYFGEQLSGFAFTQQRVPEIGEMADLLVLASARIGDDQLWVNPDCGLKTRKWEEVRPALVNMVAAARQLRRKAEAA